jgi:6-phosphogluconate dehydrogenase
MSSDRLADIGVVGLAVMGENLVLNMEGKGFTVACFNRTVAKVDAFVNGRGANRNIIGCHSLEELVRSLSRPRKVMCMVKAGEAVDELIASLIPLLEPGDILIDGGNSHYLDTGRRVGEAREHQILFVGAGISGGEEGALTGPSIMPGGAIEAWESIRPIFQRICAMTPGGAPCCEWVGPDGAGHFVKMVHNGIEYGDMQLICEVYQMMKVGLKLSNEEMHGIFSRWNTGRLDSYLIEITAEILGFRDEDGLHVLDLILDSAQQKGTGKWTVNAALEAGQPLTLIGEAVFARSLSALKDERVQASLVLEGPMLPFGDADGMVDDLQQALYASKIVSYAQGFQILRAVSLEHGWDLDHGGIARMWRNGCIIRSVFLDDIEKAFARDPQLASLLLDPFFTDAVHEAQAGWRRVVAAGALWGVPMPTLSASLAYFDGYRTARLPANLLQAQRDYFGAHTYERIDRPRGQHFHTNWTGRGGSTSSTAYEA